MKEPTKIKPGHLLSRRFGAAVVALMLLLQPVAVVLADSGGSGTGSPTTTATATEQPATGSGTSNQSTGTGSQSSTGPTTGDIQPTQGTGSTDGSASQPQPTTSSTPEPQTPTGAQPTTGPQSPVGPQTPTGPQTATGPQGQTGSQSQTGVTSPTGVVPDYAFNQQTQHWVPTNQGSFTWSPALGRYVSSAYRYDSQTGWWYVIPGIPATAAVGASAGTLSSPLLATPAIAAADPQVALAQLLGVDPRALAGSGTTNLIENSSNSALLQLLSNGLINNTNTLASSTGDATVSDNTQAGDATSGAALVVQNLLNLLNAAWSWSSGGLSYFAQNLFGNHTGDITLQPSNSVGGGGQLGNTNINSNNDFTVVNKQNGAINNDVNLLARSGNAAVTGNTQGGNAQSGDATVTLNILNMINSAINAGQSFFGMLNIFGNLDGDILFPDGFLTNLLSGPNSTNTQTVNQTTNATATNTVNGAFQNNLISSAQSGNAEVSGNTSGGSGQSGDATTKSNLFNLFDTSVTGDNAVLVLVNVMGHWVGHILNLPDSGSSTGALLGGNATATTTVNSTNNLNVTNQANGAITNNVHAGAISGDAKVSDNTIGGNAKSGNASVASNIANVFGSNLNLKKWFGILVINVFGSWNGSVADNTAAGGRTVNLPDSHSQMTSHPVASSSGRSSNSAFGNSPTFGRGGGAVVDRQQETPSVGSDPGSSGPVAALVAAAQNPVVATQAAAKSTGLLILMAAAALMLAALALSIERRLRHR